MIIIASFFFIKTCFFFFQAIARNLPPSEMIESAVVAGAGFVNIFLSKDWIAKVLHLFV